jgi:hypothetical protein
MMGMEEHNENEHHLREGGQEREARDQLCR